MENSQSQTISTLSSGMSNLFRGVQELVEMQKKQTEAIDRGFNCLIQVLSQQAPLALSSLSPLRNDVADETFESVMDPVETPILVELIRTNHTTNTYELPSVQRIFDELGGKARKMERANVPLDLLRFYVSAAWATFLDDNSRLIIPFLMDWNSNDCEFNYEKGWLKEWESWGFGEVKKWRRCYCAAMLIADGKPCLVVYYKDLDKKADCISPILTIMTPKGIEKLDLPFQHLENFFVSIVTHSAESEIFHFNDVLLQTCNPSENASEDIVCQDLSKRDFMVNFSTDVRTKNEFTDVVFWLVSICSGGVNNVGVEHDGNIFVDLRERLSIEQENKDLASYRQIVSEGVYNCVILLVEENMAVLRQDNRGMEFPDNTESAEFMKLLRSQMVSSSLPGMI